MPNKSLVVLIIFLFCSFVSATECKRTQSPEDVPCVITTTWIYPVSCSNFNMSIQNSTGTIVQNNNLSTFTPYCNYIFNITKEDSYYLSIYRAGTLTDTGQITIKGDTMDATLSFTACPTNALGFSMLIFIFLIAMALIIIGFVKKSLSIGILGSFILLIFSFVFIHCNNIIGIIMICVSILFAVIFILSRNQGTIE